MSYNYEYQQSDGNNYGSVYGSNASAAAGGSYQFGAYAGYNSIPYGSTGSEGGGSLDGTTQHSSLQDKEYATGYGGQQTPDSDYTAYSAGSTSAATGANAYTGLATAQAAMAQAAASMASGYPAGQSIYYGSGVSAGTTAAYGGLQPSSSVYPSESIAQDYTSGTGYTSGLRSSTGSLEGYAPYTPTNSTTDFYQPSPYYGSTYPADSDDGVSSSTAAFGAVAGTPVPLGSSGGFAALFR